MCSDFLERVTPGKVNYALWQEHINRYYFALPFVSEKFVLDIACGTGYGTNMLSKNAATVIGVDISKTALKHAIAYYGNNQNSTFVLADARHLPFRDDAFDFIVSFETIEHMGDFARFLVELKRVLNNDRLIMISSPNDRVNYSFNQRRPSNPYHIQEFNIEDFSRELSIFSNEIQLYGQCIYTPKDQLFRFFETNLPIFIQNYNSIRKHKRSPSQDNSALGTANMSIDCKYSVRKNNFVRYFHIFPRFIVAIVKNKKRSCNVDESVNSFNV